MENLINTTFTITLDQNYFQQRRFGFSLYTRKKTTITWEKLPRKIDEEYLVHILKVR